MSSLIHRSFTGGELAPACYARVDLVKYEAGARTLRNMIVMRHGGAANRPGTQFVAEVKDSTKAVRLIPFVFNAAETYALEFGDLYMRVVKNGALVVDSTKTITGVGNGNPCVVTAVAHGFSTGDEVAISGVGGTTQVNGRNFKIIVLTADTFSLKYMDGTIVDSTAFGVYTSGGSAARIYTIVSPYAVADLPLLKYVQSADVITIAHPSYPPAQVARTGDASWTITNMTFAPAIATPGTPSNSGAAGTTTSWVVTAVAASNQEESLSSPATGSSAIPSSGSPITLTLAAVAGAQSYNIYKFSNGVYGFIGVAGLGSPATFVDNGITPDTTNTIPIARNPFAAPGDYPSTVTYYQQRLVFGNTNNNPQGVWTSKSGAFTNFTISEPLQEDDAVTFSLVGRQVNSVKHLVEMRQLLAFTAGGEISIAGDTAGILRPGQVNSRQHSYNGSADPQPIVVPFTVLYVQARKSVIRDLNYNWQFDGYVGNDLTIFSAHLFDNFQIVEWAYQQIPQSIVWVVRNDGQLLGLTYVKEQEILAWHRHDFSGGFVENICSIPEGVEDVIYLTIRRTINGVSKRYIERMATRRVVDVIDNIFMDAALSYDGRNTGATTMTLSGGTTWAYTETMNLTASVGFFTAADVGNQIQLTGPDGTVIRFTINGFTSSTVVTGKPNKTVPVSMQGVAVTSWAKAIKTISGLWHLEGQKISVFADRFVVASPNNAANVPLTVTGGTVTLDKPYAVIHAGLPYTSDVETLDIDTPQGETVADKKKWVGKVTLLTENSRGGFVGPQPPDNDTIDPLQNLYEIKVRNAEDYDDPVSLVTGEMDVDIAGEVNNNGRVFIRQVDPIPLTVLAVVAAGQFPFRGQ